MTAILPQYVFLSDCKEVTITTGKDTRITIHEGFAQPQGYDDEGNVIDYFYYGKTLFDEILTPVNGKIILHNVDKIIKPFVLAAYRKKDANLSYIPAFFSVEIDYKYNCDFEAYYDTLKNTSFRPGMHTQVRNDGFLTHRKTRNLYRSNSTETIAAYHVQALEEIKATIMYVIEDDIIGNKTVVVYKAPDDVSISKNVVIIDISPNRIQSFVPGKKILGYNISKAAPNVGYCFVNLLNSSCELITFKYRNFYGYFDTIQIPGYLVKSNKVKRQTAIVDNQLLEYNNNLTYEYEIKAGMMLQDTIQAMTEFSLSPDIFLLENGEETKINLTDFKQVETTDKTVPLQYQISFTKSKVNFYE